MPSAVAGPRSLPLIGHSLELRRDPLTFLQRVQMDYGDICKIQVGWIPIVTVFHPDHVRQILVENHKSFIKSRGVRLTNLILGNGLLTSEGSTHRRQRKLIQPAFQKRRILSYAADIRESTEQLTARWNNGGTLDLHSEMMRLALNVATRSLFKADVEKDAPEIGKALNQAMQDFNRVISNPLGRLLVQLPTPVGLRFRAGKKKLDRILYGMINERKANPGDQGDFLSMLFAAADEEGGMTEKQIRDAAMTIFLAGHETTANALTWSLFLVSSHPDFQARLQKELDQEPETPNPENPNPLVRALFAEAMRLYPPVWAIGREATEPVQVGDHSFPAGTTFLLSPYVTHRDERFWPDADQFKPERWLNEQEVLAPPRFRYFPFGGGPRICIGEPFAWMEGTMALTQILSQWQFDLITKEPETSPLVTLRPKGEVLARSEKR